MKPSTLRAILEGDIENAIVSATPGGIEAQEAQGQRDIVPNTTLPKEFLYCEKSQFEAMGIVFGEDADDLFINVTLPDGWKKRPTDHSMWSKLVDDKERVRARIFYKAAFYDRSAHIDIVTRFRICTVFDDKFGEGCQRGASVEDCGKVIFETGMTKPQPPFDDRESYDLWHNEEMALHGEAQAWLEERYPDYKNPLVYWDK